MLTLLRENNSSYFMKRSFIITKKDGVRFAKLSGDFNPLHTNSLYGYNSIYGKNVCHGVLVLLNFLKKNNAIINKEINNLNIKFLNPVFYNKKIIIKKINLNKYKLSTDKIDLLEIQINGKSLDKDLKKNMLKKVIRLRNKNFFFKKKNKFKILENLLMEISWYAGMIYPGKSSLINVINISFDTKKLNDNKISFYSKKLHPNYPIINNKVIYNNINIFFETLDRPELKIKLEKINIKLKNKIKKIKTNILIIGGSSGIGNDLLNIFKINNKIKIFASYFKNKPNINNNNISFFKFDINRSLKKLFKLIEKNQPINIYYFATPKINLSNNSDLKKSYVKFYIKYPITILKKFKQKQIKLFYPSSTYIDEKPKTLYSKIKLKAEKKLKLFKNVHTIRIPEINTRQNLGIENKNLKNFRFYINSDYKLQKKVFFI